MLALSEGRCGRFELEEQTRRGDSEMYLSNDQGSVDANVYVVDAKTEDRARLCRQLEWSQVRVRGFASGEALLAALQPNLPGAVVASVELPDMSGFTLLNHMRRQARAMPMLLLSEADDWNCATRAVSMGIFGLFRKPADPPELVSRVREALDIDVEALAWRHRWAPFFASREALSGRERQVMERVVAGAANKVIAYDLGISEKTVEAHRGKMMRKMQVDSLAELVRVNVILEEVAPRQVSI